MTTTTVLVTGGTGFIGRHLISHFNDLGWQSVVLVRSPERAAALPRTPRVTLVPATDPLDQCLAAHRPDAIVHLATHFVARHSDPAEVSAMVAANVAFGADLAEAASATRTPIVSASSIWQHYQGASYDPVSLYAATKQALDDILRFYSGVEGLGWTRLILGDTYGPGDDRGKLLTHMLNAAARQERMVAASGVQLWDAVNVRDVVRAFVTAIEEQLSLPAMRQFQLRPLHSTTIREVAKAVERAVGRPVPVEWGGRPDRGREMLSPWVIAPPPNGWLPEVDLEAGVREIWALEYAPNL